MECDLSSRSCVDLLVCYLRETCLRLMEWIAVSDGDSSGDGDNLHPSCDSLHMDDFDNDSGDDIALGCHVTSVALSPFIRPYDS